MSKRERPSILCIGGNDSAAMAGLSMDCRTAEALGAHALSICTATTAQNSKHFNALNPVSDAVLESQLNCHSQAEHAYAAIKIGLIGDKSQLKLIGNSLKHQTAPIICDPVMAASAGNNLWDAEFIAQFKAQLMPKLYLLTPNLPEAERLLGKVINGEDAIKSAAQELLALGTQAVLIKGGHVNDAQNAWSQDYFSDGKRSFWLSSARQANTNTRGTGCCMASACASALALEYSLYDAVVIAKMTINQSLRHAYSVIGQAGAGPLAPQSFPIEQQDLPHLHQVKDDLKHGSFPECNNTKLGLYPVIERTQWLKRLLPLGITTAQLRVKDLEGEALEAEIKEAIALGHKYKCRLFINDYWQLAIKHGAYGVHLGQEDLDEADIHAIRKAGLRLGTSTHCHYEVARAHHYKPSYIAVGPVYPTTSKDMPWIPHGPAGFSYWRTCLDYPLVAIGGINAKRIQPMLEAGADSIAMITAITLAAAPEATASVYKEQIDAYQQSY
ncbi:thiamine phosphate synthase [Agaribacterium sp. ZY112]|uniref:thiamine phosphate synthase n=1 Tax=Agaribacterium sp. ZY112 TaxID=3233574 RepID=UPI003525D317